MVVVEALVMNIVTVSHTLVSLAKINYDHNYKMQVLPTDVLLEIFLYLDDYSSLSRSMSVSRYWYERIKTIDFPKSFFQVCLTKSITIPELHERYLDEKQFIIYITGHCTTYNNKVEENTMNTMMIFQLMSRQ